MTHTHLTQQTRLLLSDSRRGSAPSPAFLTLVKGNASHPAAGARNPAGSPGSSLSLLLASPGHQMQGSQSSETPRLRSPSPAPQPPAHPAPHRQGAQLGPHRFAHSHTGRSPTGDKTPSPGADLPVPPPRGLRLASPHAPITHNRSAHKAGLPLPDARLLASPRPPPPLGHDSVLAPQLPRGRPPTPPAFPETQFGPPDVCCDPRRRLSQLRSRRRNCLRLPVLRVPEAGAHLPPASRAPAQPPTRSKPSLGATPVTDARQTVTAPRKSRVRGRRQGG